MTSTDSNVPTPPEAPREPTQEAEGPSVGLFKKLVFMVVVLVLFVGVIEGAARLFLADPADSPLMIPVPGKKGEWKHSELHAGDPYLFWRNRANANLVYKGVEVSTNAFGMRDDATTKRKPKGTFRIISLGESTTFGSKVAQGETYGARLEACLDERVPDERVEVLNIGTPGWSLVQSYVYLDREGVDFAPDMVLVYHGYNDFLGTSFVSKRVEGTGEGATAKGATDLELAMRPRSPLERAGGWLNDHSRAFRVMGHRIRQFAANAQSKAPKKSVDEAQPKEGGKGKDEDGARVPEADRREVLARLARLAKDRDFELVILVPCYRTFDEHRDVLLDFAAQEGVRIIDLEPAVAALGGTRADQFEDESHPTSELHAEFAALLCDKLAVDVKPPGAGE